MKLKLIASNMTELEVNNYLILFSYQTPVAYFRPGVGYRKTGKKWSATTSRHISKWLLSCGISASNVPEVPQGELDALVAGRE